MKKDTKKTSATEEQRAKTISEYRASGLTIGDFCEKAGLSRSTFTSWLAKEKRAAKSNEKGAVKGNGTSKIIEKYFERGGDVVIAKGGVFSRLEKLETDVAEMRKFLIGD